MAVVLGSRKGKRGKKSSMNNPNRHTERCSGSICSPVWVPVILKAMHRKAVWVKGIKPIHFEKRTREAFSVGDEAWVSFDGRRALPVLVTGADDETHYRVDVPSGSWAGGCWLFRDEVRSTPRLACIHCVTF